MKGKEATIKDYQERLNDVLVYIHDHLDEKLELGTLANVSNFSSFHFHRIFKAFLNEPLGAYILRARLERSAKLLEFKQDAVKDIALEVGFDVTSSFNKAFKKRFGTSPEEFRKTKKMLKPFDISQLNQTVMELKLKPQIKTIKEKKVIYIRSIGKYGGQEMGVAWQKLWQYIKDNKLFSFGMQSLGIGHDDPSVTETDKLRYDACVTIKKEVKAEGEIATKTIAGGKYAIFKYKGPYSNLGHVYNHIFRNWLPESGHQLADEPCYDIYLNHPDKTSEEKLKTHVYVPLKA